MKNKTHQELLQRVLLNMSYDNRRTYSENLSNIKKVLKEQENNPKDNLFNEFETVTLPGGKTYRIPKWDGANKAVPPSWSVDRKKFFQDMALSKQVPEEKKKLFVDTMRKIYETPNIVSHFSTPAIGNIPEKRWGIYIQWPTSGDNAYMPGSYYYVNQKVKGDYYDEKDYIKIKKGKTDVAPKEVEIVKKGIANPNIGIEGPLMGNENLAGQILNVDSFDKNYYIKWRIFNNSTKPMSFNDIKVTNLPIQYEAKLLWDKKKILKENGDFLDVNLSLNYKKEEGPKKTQEKSGVQSVVTAANNQIGKSASLNEQTQEESESALTPFEGKITLPMQYFTLDVDTNLGKTTQNVIVDEIPDIKNETTKRVLVDRAVNRKSVYGDKDVPEGYSPFSYDEYLVRNAEMNKLILSWGESTPTGKAITPNVLQKMPLNIKRYYEELSVRLKKLGYNSKFPKGITPEDSELFYQTKGKLQKELDALKSKLEELKSSYAMEVSNDLGVPQEVYNSAMYKDKDYLEMTKKIQELEEELKITKYRYGYDDRNWFDKFWDDYGLAVNIGLAILSAALTFGASAPASTGFIASMLVRAGLTADVAASMGVTARALTALDTYMNVGLGTYFAIKGDGLNAIMSLFFALLPKIHTLYGKIGDYFGPKISEETAIKLQQLFSNTVIRNQDDLNAIIATLSNAEKKYVYNFMRTPNNVMSEALSVAQKNMDEIAKAEGKAATQQLKLDLSSSGSVAGSLLKGGAMIGIDYLIIKNLEHMYDAVISSINCYCRGKKGKPCSSNQIKSQEGMKGTIEDFEKYKFDCLVTAEERNKWKSYLSSLTPSEFRNLGMLLQFVSQRATPDQNFEIQQGIVKHGVTEKTLDTIQKVTVEKGIKKLREKGLDPNEVADVIIKELEEQFGAGKEADIGVEDVTGGKVGQDDLNSENKPDNNNTLNKN